MVFDRVNDDLEASAKERRRGSALGSKPIGVIKLESLARGAANSRSPFTLSTRHCQTL